MTDVAAGTMALASDDTDARDTALSNFYNKHAKGNDLILCKWFTMQAFPPLLSHAARDDLDIISRLQIHDAEYMSEYISEIRICVCV